MPGQSLFAGARAKRATLALFAPGFIWAWPRAVSAQTSSYNATTGNWSTAANWSSGIPANGYTAALPAASANYTVTLDQSYSSPGLGSLTIDGEERVLLGGTIVQYTTSLLQNQNVTMYAGSELIGNAGSGFAVYSQSAGTNTVTTNFFLGYGAGANGTYNMSGGTLTMGSGNYTESIGYSGNGIFNHSGGLVSVNDLNIALNSGSTGSYNLSSNGSLYVGGGENVGFFGSATFTQSGGYHSVGGAITLAGGSGGQGTYNLQGGNLIAQSININPGGTFNQTGGSISSNTTVNLYNGTIAGTFVNNGTFNFNYGTMTGQFVNQGTVNLANSAYMVCGNGILNYTSMAIGPTNQIVVQGTGLNNQGTLTLSGGSLQIQAATVNNALLTGFGVIWGTAGFTNNSALNAGAGTLYIESSGSNTNNGNINLTAGFPLNVTSNLSNAGTINLNGGTLAGSGTITNTASGTVAGYGAISNTAFQNTAGTVVAQGGALSVAAFTNSGSVQVEPGATLTGGTITNPGGLRGAGTVLNSVNSTGTIEAVGGVLTLKGALTNTGTGTINATLGNEVIATGFSTNAASINVAGGVLDTGGQTLTNTGSILGYGSLRTGGLTNSGTITLSGGSTVVSGAVTNTAAHTLSVLYTPALFTGNVINNGTITVTKTTATFAGTFTNNGTYISDPSTSYFQDLNVSSTGYLTGGSGDQFIVNGNFTNNSTQAASWNTSAAQLQFQGGTGHTMNVVGNAGQFGWGTLGINTADTLTINGNSATAASTYNEGSLVQTAGASNLGTVSGTGRLSVGNPSGGAAAAMTVNSFAQSAVTINATGSLAVAHASSPVISTASSLSIAPGGKLDLSNTSLQINYGAGPSPLATIRSELFTGYDAGKWDGTGIVTSVGDANHSIGYIDTGSTPPSGQPADALELKLAVPGDTTLKGSVNLSDLLTLVRDFGKTNADWAMGDFNYDGTVNLADFLILARHFGGGLSPTVLASLDSFDQAQLQGMLDQVPEPGSLALLAGAGILLPRTRRGLVKRSR